MKFRVYYNAHRYNDCSDKAMARTRVVTIPDGIVDDADAVAIETLRAMGDKFYGECWTSEAPKGQAFVGMIHLAERIA